MAALVGRLPPVPGPQRPELGDRKRQIASVYVWVQVTSGEHYFAPRPIEAAPRDPGSLERAAEHHLAPDAPKPARPPLHQPQSRARHHRGPTCQNHRRSPSATPPAGMSTASLSLTAAR